MKKITAVALMGLMALSVGLSAREAPLSVSSTATGTERAPYRASVLYGRTAAGDLQQVLVGPTGSLSTSPGSGTQDVNVVGDTVGLALDASVDGLEALVTSTNALLTTIDADTGSLAGTVSGSELQVDIVTGPTGASALEVQGTGADGVAVVGDPVRVAGKDGSGNTQDIFTSPAGILGGGLIATGADGANNALGLQPFGDTGVGGDVQVRPSVFNGTTWDRLRGDTGGLYSILKSDDGVEDVHTTGAVPASPALFNVSAPGYVASNQPVAQRSDILMDATTEATPKFAIINATVNGDNEIVAAVGGKKIRVLSITWVADGTVTVQWESGTAGNFISGPMQVVAGGGASPAYSPVGIMETVVGESLNLILTGTPDVGGMVTYIEVD